ncbi:MAG: MoaD/ThiS family protein [Helicobacteraceae bacterium]|jgi:molybdopterin synthase sulfur carrier subunit|nr:MoaD/ThiS family protein [Helicobacteraceae bacterium]
MITIEFLGPIGKEPIRADVSNLSELASMLSADKMVSGWLGRCAVAINGELVESGDYPLKEGDTVALLPPVCGG